MNCNCINKIDDKLREKNIKLVGYALVFPSFKPVITIETEWVNRDAAPKGKKTSPPKMFASHCPFCGVEIKIDKE